MSLLKPSEKRFEDHIEVNLLDQGYVAGHYAEYDRTSCLINDDVVRFIKTTQPNQWKKLVEIYEDDVENKLINRISSEIGKRGVLDVLRNKIVDRGVYLDLIYFEPKSGLNEEHQKLYGLNILKVVRQLHYSVRNENSIDMVIFINGIPIITMELKNQLTGQNIRHSENQYMNDRDPNEPLLKFKRCLVHFCVDNNKVSMSTRLSGLKTRFLPFNQELENPPVEGGYRTEYLWKEILTKESVLDILENFMLLSNEEEYDFNEKTQKVEKKINEILIFPRYHQLNLIRMFRSDIKRDGVGKNYLVQHTTGSGKSYSIGWLSHTLSSLYQSQTDTKRIFDTVIVVTDRTVLDDQLRNTIRSLEKIDGVVNGVEKGSKELKGFLESGKDIIVTTIQKFPFISETIASLKDKKFAVIIDEVHSSQSGELSKELKRTLSGDDLPDDEDYDYEEYLRREIESRGKQTHISFFGFTGTPKQKTLELFGTKTADGQYVPYHIYSMYQSINEGFTLDVLQNYTTFKRYFKVKQINNEDIEISSSKGKKELVKFVDSHELTIQNKVGVILDHFISKGSREIQGKARGMIVVPSRVMCVRYFFEINKQLKERGITYQSLVGFSGEVSLDGQKYTEEGLNLSIGHEGNVPLGLKNPKYRLLVVANKFQTGFDEPLVQSMYVDKRLDGVQCVQTLSRLNRTTRGKTQTFVLDFVNEPETIRDSFQLFYKSTILEGETDPNRLYDLQRDIFDFHLYTHQNVDDFCKIFFDPNRDEGQLHPVLDMVVDKWKEISEEDDQEKYRSFLQSYLRMYGYLSQIIKFSDIELEKSFIFYKYLNKKLPKRKTQQVDLSESVDLESLRIQKTFEKIAGLEDVDSVVEPPSFESGTQVEPVVDLLSEIISQVNKVYGVNLTEEDKLDLSNLNKRLVQNTDIQKYMNDDNSEENKKNYFRKEFESIIVDYVNERFEFYKKMDDNQSMKNSIFNIMYEQFKKQGSGDSVSRRT
jgi:type I restriction enzyme R subunit